MKLEKSLLNLLFVTKISLRFAAPIALLLAGSSPALAQDNEVYELSPFEVDGSGDVGYAAQNTLAGSRMNSRLKDTPAPVTVFTKEFIEDIGADSLEETLEYSVNMTPELSQDDGTFGGNQLTAFDARFRIRGLDADQARNYFAYEWDQDVYNLERIDESRGPNSILFGVAKAGGLINSSTKKPILGNEFTTVNLTLGDADRLRGHIDYNKVLIEDVLGIRLNILHNENGENDRAWAYRRDDRYHLSLKYKPLEKTTIDFEYEYGDVMDSPTMPFGPQDRASQWLAAGRPLVGGEAGSAEGIIGTINRISYVDNGAGLIANHRGSAATSLSDAGPRDNHFTYENNVLSDPAGFGTLVVPPNGTTSGPLVMRGARDIRNMSANLNQQLGENTFVELSWAKYEVDRFSHRGVGPDLLGDPNPTLADGSPNPYAGELYFESRLERDSRFFTEDYIRATISHEIKTDSWVGNHRLAAMGQSRQSEFRRDSEMYVWTNPEVLGQLDSQGRFIGGPFNRTIWNGNNQVYVRHYLEDPNDLADWRVGAIPGIGFGDNWDGDPITVSVPAESLAYDTGLADGTPVTLVSDWQTLRVKDEESSIDAMMIAGQSSFLNEKLFLTWGLREDDFYLFSPNGNGIVNTFDGQRDIIDRDNALVQEFVGETESYGGVYHINQNFSVFYNSSTNAGISDFSDKDIFGGPGEAGGINPVPNGESEDYGFTVDLLEGKLFLKAAFYETTSNNVSSFVAWVDGNAISLIKNTYDELQDQGLIDASTYDSQQITAEVGTKSESSEGFEFTAVGNINDNWRAMLNYSDTELMLSDSLPEFTGWWEGSTGKPFFEQYASQTILMPGNVSGDLNQGATFADAIALIQRAGDAQQALAGGISPGQRQTKWNFFTNYTFDEGPLKSFRVGGGARFTDGRIQVHPTLGVLEHNDWLFYDAVFGWKKKFEKYTLDLQLNIRNLFDEDELSINQLDTTANAQGVFEVRNYILPQARDIKLRASFRF
ncbi:MAG: TonB-dependent receptor plug domain-containing protein [Verrucomicrobiota bacterium]